MNLTPPERRELAQLARSNIVVRKLLRLKVQYAMGLDAAFALGTHCVAIVTYRPWYKLFWGSIWWCHHCRWVWQRCAKRTPHQTGWNKGHTETIKALVSRLR